MLSLNSLVHLQCFFLSPSHSQTIKFQSFALACLSVKPLPISPSVQFSVTCSERVTQSRWVERLCKCKVSKWITWIGETDFHVWLKKTLRSKRGRSSYFSERMNILFFKMNMMSYSFSLQRVKLFWVFQFSPRSCTVFIQSTQFLHFSDYFHLPGLL